MDFWRTHESDDRQRVRPTARDRHGRPQRLGGAGLRAFANIAEALGPERRRSAQVVRHRFALHVLQVAARTRSRLPRRHARTSLLSARHLQVAADPAAGSHAPRTTGCASPTPRRLSVADRRSNACCPARWPTCTSCASTSTPSVDKALTRRSTRDGRHITRHRACGEVRAVPSHRREPAADDSSVRAGRGSGRLGRALQARIHNESAHPQRRSASCSWCRSQIASAAPMRRWSWRRSRICRRRARDSPTGTSAPTTPPSPSTPPSPKRAFIARISCAPPVSRPSNSRCAVISPMSPASCTTCAAGACELPDIYDPASYAASQKLGRAAARGGLERHRLRQRAAQRRRMRGALPTAAGPERAPERASALRLGRQLHLRGLRDPCRQSVAPQHPGFRSLSGVPRYTARRPKRD